jgi:hypothetical protein
VKTKVLEHYEAVVEVQLHKGIGEIDKVDVKIDENIKGEEDANTHTCAKDNLSDEADETVQDDK